MAELRRLYEERGKLVFDDSWWDNLCDLGKTRGADYPPTLGSSGAASKTKKLADSRKSRRSCFAEADGQYETVRLSGSACGGKDLNKRVLIPAFDPASRSATQGKPGQPAFAKLRRAGENPVVDMVGTDVSAVALA